MKKLISILLALTLVLSLSVAAMAADPTDGTITINSANEETTYSIYRLLILEGFEKGAAYSYTIDPDWAAFFNQSTIMNQLIKINEHGYVEWIGAEDDTTMANFAKEALAYADANSIAPVQVSGSANPNYAFADGKGVFSNLGLGWYLVDSNAGALCALTTTDKDAIVNAKNKIPTIDKQVKEDLTGQWGDSNSADIGQIVEFRTTIYVAAGAQNYVLHDKMEGGLTFQQVSKIEVAHTGTDVHTPMTAGTDYTVLHNATGCTIPGCTDHTDCSDCTFEVVFKPDVIKSLLTTDAIVVYYEAMLNRYAETGNENDDTTAYNQNESWLEYGEEHFTTHDKTETYTFTFDIVKTDSSNKLLKGATFRIYDALTGGKEVAVTRLYEADNTTPIKDAYGNQMYRRCRDGEPGELITVEEGVLTLIGFDNGTYYLEEITPPTGYNKLTGRQEFSISNANSTATIDKQATGDYFIPGPGVHVINKTGTMLPETGAEGTFLFITLGLFTVLATGVLLVTKKRMSMIRE